MTGALINHLWQSTLFCAAVWLVTLALRANGAALRHWLWLIASLKFLVPFSALHALGAMLGVPASDSSGLSSSSVFSQAMELAVPVVSPAGSPVPALILLDAAPRAAWSNLLVLAWMAGAALVALRWWRAWRAADSLTRAARPVPGASLDLRVTDAAIEPAVARVFRPVVLLPSALLGRLSAAQLDAVLAHEREHIGRRDNLVAHLQRLVEALFWFHPLVWWIGRRLVEERERAVDEAVLGGGHDAQEYAGSILEVCRHCHELARLPATSSALSGNLTARIRGIIADTAPRAPGLLKTLLLGLVTLGVAMAPLYAGAVEGAARRLAQLERDTRALLSARFSVTPAADVGRETAELVAGSNYLLVRHSTLRELVALAYEVAPSAVAGGGDWLDAQRYDIRVDVHDAFIGEDFQPAALRGTVNELLAARFDLQVHVNQHCQQPCGRRALLENHSP